MVGLHVIEYLLRVPWVWGFQWGFQWGFPWVWDGYGDWNAIPTAALRNTAAYNSVLVVTTNARMLKLSEYSGAEIRHTGVDVLTWDWISEPLRVHGYQRVFDMSPANSMRTCRSRRHTHLTDFISNQQNAKINWTITARTLGQQRHQSLTGRNHCDQS